MNRRRILAALISVTLLTLGALFLPSLHKTPPPAVEPTTPAASQAASAASVGTAPAQPNVSTAPPAIPSSALATAAAPPPSPQVAVPPQDIDPHKAFGSKTAPVIMEIFSDYQCPACKTLYTTTNRQLMDNYVSTGKVYVIHRDFPLAMHAYSRIAARYARAAATLGKVEPVEQALFENQEKWEQTGDVDGTVAAVLSAGEMTKVRALVKGGTLEPLIDKDFSLGQMYRVNQTPTTIFHANGQTYPFAGVMTNDTLKTFLDQLLSQK
ncbi:MAG TPA: thioredoxin domain-containing protein [Candidatus Angelobacter sp.]|nr:thioredoxin domain-containing protein [Candidatus Angelobacter sp.]